MKNLDNNWFVIQNWTIEDLDDEEIEVLKNDNRVIVSADDEIVFVHKDNIAAIEKEYEIEIETITEYLDVCFGDWEEFYYRYILFLGVSEHLAYELVGGRIVDHIEEMATNINNLSVDSIKKLTRELLDKYMFMIFEKWFDVYSNLLEIQYKIFVCSIRHLFYAGLTDEYELPSDHDSPRDLTWEEFERENKKLAKILKDNNITIQ